MKDGAIIVGFLLILILILLSPIGAIYDVATNNRMGTGIVKDMSNMTLLHQIIHMAYLVGVVSAALFLVFVVPENLNSGKGVFAGILLILYMLPMAWLIYSIPGYWKVAVYFVLDLMSED